MALLYSTHCASCGYKTEYPDAELALQHDDGSLSFLVHPGERDALEELGFARELASDEARLIESSWSICRECGGMYESRRRVAPVLERGCRSLPAMIVMVLIVGIALLSRWWWIAGVTAVAFIWGVLDETVRSIRSRRAFNIHLSDRLPIADERCCANAKPTSLVGLNDIEGDELFVCSECGVRAVTVRFDGIS